MKGNLSDIFYALLIKDIETAAYGLPEVDAWVTTWHMRINHGYETKQLNYYLGKLVTKGVLLKRTSCYCTRFSPVALEGFRREGDNFIRV